MLKAIGPGSEMLRVFDELLFRRFSSLGGNQPVNFSSGNPAFDPFPPALEASRGAHSDYIMRIYGSNFGVRSEREMMVPFCENLKISPKDQPLDAKHIMPGMGVTFLYAALLETIAVKAAEEKPGKTPIVLMTSPSYGLFAMQGEPFGMRVETVRLSEENKWQIDPEALDRRIKELNTIEGQYVAAFNHINPHNPMGTVEVPEVTQGIARVLRANNVFGIDDLAYLGQEYGQQAVPLAAFDFENSASLFSLSKTYGAPGLRAGFACAPTDVIESLSHVVTRTIQCVPHPTRAALSATYSPANDDARRAYIAVNREGYKQKYQIVQAFVKGIDNIGPLSNERREQINNLFRQGFGDVNVANKILSNGVTRLKIVNDHVQSGYFSVLKLEGVNDRFYGTQRLDNSFKVSAALIDQGRILTLPMMCALAEEQLSDSVRITFGLSDARIVRGLRGVMKTMAALTESPDAERQKELEARGFAFEQHFD